MPLDPVSLETTIRFVKGSNNWGKWFYPRKFATFKNYSVTGESERLFLDAVEMQKPCHFGFRAQCYKPFYVTCNKYVFLLSEPSKMNTK